MGQLMFGVTHQYRLSEALRLTIRQTIIEALDSVVTGATTQVKIDQLEEPFEYRISVCVGNVDFPVSAGALRLHDLLLQALTVKFAPLSDDLEMGCHSSPVVDQSIRNLSDYSMSLGASGVEISFNTVDTTSTAQSLYIDSIEGNILLSFKRPTV
jgi:hypothetical protein